MKRALKYAIPVAALVAQGIDEPAVASDLFLDINGIPGESVTQGYEGEIDILAWSWGSEIDVLIGGGGTGKASFTPLKIIKSVDSATPLLIAQLTTGAAISDALLTATRFTGQAEEPFMKLTLEQIYVTKVAQGGDDNSEGVAETVTLDYGKIKIEYRALNSKGTWGPWQSTCFDRIKNAKC